MHIPFVGNDFIERLHQGDLIPQNCRRVIIDIAMDNVARVYFECNADVRIIAEDLFQIVENAAVECP